MLRESKEVAINVTATVVVVGLGAAFLAGIGLILARETYRDWRGKDEDPQLKDPWKEKNWPRRVRKTLLGDDHPELGTKK